MVVREPRAGAAAARTTRCSAPSVAAPANMLPPSFPAPGKHILGVVFFSLFRIRFRNTAFLPGWQIILPEPIVGFGSVAKPILFRSAPTFGSTCRYIVQSYTKFVISRETFINGCQKSKLGV